MKTVGFITEYNPFHNGHLYHIQKAREITNADHIIVVMSGDFVQRGAPAILPKHLRTQMALQCGVSAVFELPVCYACGSAELFATGAISLLEQLGVVDTICFGSECDDLSAMQRLANVLATEPDEYKILLKSALKRGLNFPTARQDALEKYLNTENCAFLLEHPNNILGIEYLKALIRLKSPMKPYTIRRLESDYHETRLQANYSSASAIRHLLAYSGSTISSQSLETSGYASFSNVLAELENQVPPSCFNLLLNNHGMRYPVYQNDFSLLLKHRLMKKSAKQLTKYQDMNRDLANRIQRELGNYMNFEQYCELLKTKDITYTRVNRALTHILLGLCKKDIAHYKEQNYHYYAKLLGFRKDSQKLLRAISQNSRIPLFTKAEDMKKIRKDGKKMLKKDIFASDLYESAVTDRYKTAFLGELQKPIVKV